MSQLEDCRRKLTHLLEVLRDQELAYQRARNMFTQLEQGDDVDLSNIGLQMVLGDDTAIPVPMLPVTQVRELMAGCVNTAGQAMIATWAEIFNTAGVAHQHCTKAAEETDAETSQPAPQPPRQPQQPQPRTGAPLHTEPIG